MPLQSVWQKGSGIRTVCDECLVGALTFGGRISSYPTEDECSDCGPHSIGILDRVLINETLQAR
jgi:hypothetical protein